MHHSLGAAQKLSMVWGQRQQEQQPFCPAHTHPPRPLPHRFVCTAEFEAAAAAQPLPIRGSFTTPHPGGPASNAQGIMVKNTSNASAVCWGGRLWSLCEGGT